MPAEPLPPPATSPTMESKRVASQGVAVAAAFFSLLLAGLGHLYLTPALARWRGPTVATGLAVGLLMILWSWLPLGTSILLALTIGAVVAVMVPYTTPPLRPLAAPAPADGPNWSTRGFLLLGSFAGLYLLSMQFPPAMNVNIAIVIFSAFDAYSIGIRGHGIV